MRRIPLAVHRLCVRRFLGHIHPVCQEGSLPVSTLTITLMIKKKLLPPSSSKMIPWFVSDVTPPDFKSTIPSLLSETFFSSSDAPSDPKQHDYLRQMVTRWQSYLDSGVFELSVPIDSALGDSHAKGDFWTGPWAYWDLQAQAPDLWEDLKTSSLVIFKVSAMNAMTKTL
jgi:damage-control phosphatase, subfamily III